MALGPGRYDDVTTIVREQTQGKAVIVIVLRGNQGSGFSMQAEFVVSPFVVAATLEQVANQIRESTKGPT